MSADALWWVYLVRCGDGSIYTGVAQDVARRLSEHRSGGARAARYVRGRGPLRLLVAQPVGSRGDALRVEYRVKQLSARHKRAFALHPGELADFIAQLIAPPPALAPLP